MQVGYDENSFAYRDLEGTKASFGRSSNSSSLLLTGFATHIDNVFFLDISDVCHKIAAAFVCRFTRPSGKNTESPFKR